MYLLCGIVMALIFTVLELRKTPEAKNLKNRIRVFLRYGFTVNIITLGVMKFVFQTERVLFPASVRVSTLLILIGLYILLALLSDRLHRWEKKHAIVVEAGKSHHYGLRITSVILVFLGILCVTMTLWAKQEYGDLPADQILITYFSPTVGSDMVDSSAVIEGPIFTSLFGAVVFGVFAFSCITLTHNKNGETTVYYSQFTHRIICIVLACIIFIGGLTYGIVRIRLVTLYNAYFSHSRIIDSNFVDPRDANLQFPEQKRNLIHIYLESVENSYMSKDLGGFMEMNLIPELTTLAEEGYSFSHLDHQFGGPESAVGTTWSVASMVNMSTGLPMKAPTEPNAYGEPGNFLPGAWTMGDILKEQGYNQSLMFGADADFGGLSYYFQSHGDFHIMDYKYARETGMIPRDYLVWWGFEDDKLFEFAKDEITRLSEAGKPFHFIMETADTHRPDGYLSKYAETPYPNQYANVVAYSSRETMKFVRWIQDQPFYDNTTIIITGDHLSMETNFFEFYKFDDSYRRSQYNVILNPAPGVASRDHDILFNREYANFDFFPTILTSLGVTYDGHRLGIGTDLFSGADTIFEEYGFKKANKELEKLSPLYNEKILKSH